MTTHVLDTAAGAPPSGMSVTLLTRADDGTWPPVGSSDTHGDGRVTNLPTVANGLHSLRFLTTSAFFPEITVTFNVTGETYLHIPLLLRPFGYTTYPGHS